MKNNLCNEEKQGKLYVLPLSLFTSILFISPNFFLYLTSKIALGVMPWSNLYLAIRSIETRVRKREDQYLADSALLKSVRWHQNLAGPQKQTPLNDAGLSRSRKISLLSSTTASGSVATTSGTAEPALSRRRQTGRLTGPWIRWPRVHTSRRLQVVLHRHFRRPAR